MDATNTAEDFEKIKQIEEILKNESLRPASSYLRIPKDNFILIKGNLHSYCKVAPPYDAKKIRKKPSIFKRFFNTLF